MPLPSLPPKKKKNWCTLYLVPHKWSPQTTRGTVDVFFWGGGGLTICSTPVGPPRTMCSALIILYPDQPCHCRWSSQNICDTAHDFHNVVLGISCLPQCGAWNILSPTMWCLEYPVSHNVVLGISCLPLLQLVPLNNFRVK